MSQQDAALQQWWDALTDDQRAEQAAIAAGAPLSPEDLERFTKAGVLLAGGAWVERPQHVFTMPDEVAEFVARKLADAATDAGGERLDDDEVEGPNSL
jgi:hypothetical protein